MKAKKATSKSSIEEVEIVEEYRPTEEDKSREKSIKTEEKVPELGLEQKEEIKFTDLQLREALLYLEDVMDRALMKWFLTGKTARQCKGNMDLEGDITAGVLVQDLTAGIGILKSAAPELTLECVPEESKLVSDSKFISIIHNKIPIKIKVFHNKYEVFNHLDRISYDVADFWLPNPFPEYFANKEQYE